MRRCVQTFDWYCTFTCLLDTYNVWGENSILFPPQISYIPELNFLCKISGNFPEMYRKVSAPLQP